MELKRRSSKPPSHTLAHSNSSSAKVGSEEASYTPINAKNFRKPTAEDRCQSSFESSLTYQHRRLSAYSNTWHQIRPIFC